jgi:hypothetical protein
MVKTMDIKGDIIGICGTVMAVSFPVLNVLKDWLQIVGAVGGIILVIYSIQHKRMEIKKFKGKK